MRPVKQGGCMVAEDTVFTVLYDKFMFWSILVGIFTFGWMFLAMLRYREGVEPDTTHIDHIEVGSFPVDRHNTPLEVMFYVLPTLIVTWLVVLALASNTAVWQIDPEDEDVHNMEIIGKQWFWEYKYSDSLTWEDDPSTTNIDVTWSGTTLAVTSTNDAAVNVNFSKGVDEGEQAINFGEAMVEITFNPFLLSTVEVTDIDGEVIHTWMHIPKDHIFSSAAGEDMILPCDVEVVFEMHSKPSDDSNPNYIGVQHSFWLPEWGVKEDLVPGLETGTYMSIMADDPGTFPIRCAEYCGNQHSMMYGQVTIVAAEGMDCKTDTGVKKTTDGSSGGDY
jgi:heme/copper-type cytochrome/quinol oxidase subunit 2